VKNITSPSKQQYKSFTPTCPEHNTISLEQYNKLMSNMLNERRTLAKLRAELEGREGRLCRKCGGFGHLA